MARAAAVLLSLLVVIPVLGATADLSARIRTAPDRLRPLEAFSFTGEVTNLGPDPATSVRVGMSDKLAERCVYTVARIEPGETLTFQCQGEMTGGQNYSTAVGIYAGSLESSDPVYANNSGSSWIDADTPPDLFVFTSEVPVAVPGLAFAINKVIYGNRARTTAHAVRVTLDSPFGFQYVPDFCEDSGTQATCTIGTIAPADRDAPWSNEQHFGVVLKAPDESAKTFPIAMAIDGAEDDAAASDDRFEVQARTYLTFFVTSAADSGTGSFREAIHSANARCVDTTPCLIAFRIPPSGQRWHTISLETALPRVATNNVRIDADVQWQYFTNTNEEGPEIELDGRALKEGHGLDVVEMCTVEIRGLVINGFPGNGITISQGPPCTNRGRASSVVQNSIGTDPTGTVSIPNARGIWIASPGWLVLTNLISGNRNAGIFVWKGQTIIAGNRVGLDRVGKPLGNRASGVFIGPEGSGSEVIDNQIGFNGHFGIAIASDARYVSASGNSIAGNVNQGIDWGLDALVTTSEVPVPEITSVRVEEGKTIIEGTTTAVGTFAPWISLFFNDEPDPSGYGEGQHNIGETRAEAGPGGLTFRFISPQNLRGRWITATATRHFYTGWLTGNSATGWGYFTTTSEFSRAVRVE